MTGADDLTEAAQPGAPGIVRSSDGLAVTAPRVVCQFSCGAASAVATKLALAQYGSTHEVLIVNAFISEEDDDNRRFLADCEQWFGHPVVVLRDEKYGASVFEVWRRKQYMKGQKGAPCSRELKRKVLDAIKRQDDVLVFGFTVEETERFNDFTERNPLMQCRAPLIEQQLSKGDCLAMVQRAGIELPLMYRQGFENANCPNCPKGGEGYWNRIRIMRPESFRRTMEAQEAIGPGAYFFRNRKTEERFGLKDLDPSAGRHDEPAPACSFFCELAEQEYAA